ncbi:hypothetical protein [Burkholderia sp. Bp8963]|uniref:hypothetical protein n=1 Tax=Burkholderia sp. Bp8963 TaxID=2184547 RepID=UPI00163A3B4D|nr:hypothetical protein [Burkholderia sp. Bp8963]
MLEACKAHGARARIHITRDLSAIFEFDVVRGLANSNPIWGLRGLLRLPDSQSKTVLTLEQIQAFYQRLKSDRSYPEQLRHRACMNFVQDKYCPNYFSNQSNFLKIWCCAFLIPETSMNVQFL